MKKSEMILFDKIITHSKDVIEIVSSSIENGSNLLLTYFNQHCFNVYWEDKDYKEYIDNQFSIYLDGYGLYFVLEYIFHKKSNKFNASDINSELFKYFIRSNKKVIIIGGRFADKIVNTNALTVEHYFNGYEDTKDVDQLIEKIQSSKTKIIIIGMGVHLQEKIAIELSKRISGLQIICVGNFLEFYFGTIKRAPKFLHNSGFEWLFRLITEPRRLWKRYLIGIPVFILRVLILKFKH